MKNMHGHQFYYQHHPSYNTATPFMRRAFHDAIYEEEYGSESEEECCRGRGMSAILCWFLSVIILIGLAASVVLTVFFILKSRSFLAKNNGDLDILYEGDQGNGLVYPTTTELNLDFTSSSFNKDKRPVGDDPPQMTSTPPPNRGSTRRMPTSAERMPIPPKETSLFNIFLDGMSKFENNGDFPITPSKEAFANFPLPHPGSEEIISNESQERNVHAHGYDTEESDNPHFTTTTTARPSQQILFTIPPTPVTTANPLRRSLQTTKFPNGRTSFSTASPTEATKELEEKSEINTSTNARYNPYGRADGGYNNRGNSEEEDQDHESSEEEEAKLERPTTNEPEVDVNYRSDESQLKKMLLDQIPPHKEDGNTRKGSSRERTSFTTSGTSTTVVPRTTEPSDTLARIIKNLAPKWGRNKTDPTQATTTTFIPTTIGSNKYNITINTRDRLRNRDSNEPYSGSEEDSTVMPSNTRPRFGRPTTEKSYVFITPETISTTTTLQPTTRRVSSSIESALFPEFGHKLGARRGNHDNPIEIIPSPDLNQRNRYDPENEHNNSQDEEGRQEDDSFLDVLVGSDDHKTLVTKETKDGIVTSAILPPWYDANTKDENISDIMNMNGSSKSVSVAKTLHERESYRHPNNETEMGIDRPTDKPWKDEEDRDEENASYPASEFDLLLNLFSQSPSPRKENVATTRTPLTKQSTFTPSAVVQHDQSQPNARRPTATRKTPNFKDLMRDLLPGLSSPNPTQNPARVDEANTAFHVGSHDGTTDIYGYYPDEDLEPDKTVQQQGVQSERLEDMIEDPLEESPSHVIDLMYHPHTRPEIIIEPEGQDETDMDYGLGGDSYSSGSNVHQSVVPAPPGMGSGIRRPFSTEDLEFGESDPQPSYITTTTTSTTTTTQAPQLLTTAPPGEKDISKEEDSIEESDESFKDKENNFQKSSPDEPNRSEEGPTSSEEIQSALQGGFKNPQTKVSDSTHLQGGSEGRIQSNREYIIRQPIGGDRRQPIGGDRRQPIGGDRRQPTGGDRRQPTRKNETPNSSAEVVTQQSTTEYETVNPNNIDRSRNPIGIHRTRDPSGVGRTRYQAEVDEIRRKMKNEHGVDTAGKPAGVNYGTFRPSEVDRTQELSDVDERPAPSVSYDDQGAHSQSYDETEGPPTGYDDENRPLNDSYEYNSAAASEEMKDVSRPDETKDETDLEINDVVERRPVTGLDEKLYPSDEDSSSTPSPTTDARVHRVYSVSYDASTTESTKDLTAPIPTSALLESDAAAFVPPPPQNFHENRYTFSPQIPNPEAFPTKDGWRPVVYDRKTDTGTTSSFPNNIPSPSTDLHSTQPTNPTPYHNGQHITSSAASLSPVTSTEVPLTDTANEDYDDDVDEDEEELEDEQNNHAESNNQQNQWRDNGVLQQQSQQLPIKPSQPIPSPASSQVKFPEEENSEQSQKPISPQSTFQNTIDRSKYLVRPAPPPIVMRRTPHTNMPYLATRHHQPTQMSSKIRTHFVQQPPQHQHQPHHNHPHQHGHSDYHPPHPNKNLPGSGRPGPARYKPVVGPRPRGHINWPTEENRRKYPTNRISG